MIFKIIITLQVQTLPTVLCETVETLVADSVIRRSMVTKPDASLNVQFLPFIKKYESKALAATSKVFLLCSILCILYWEVILRTH